MRQFRQALRFHNITRRNVHEAANTNGLGRYKQNGRGKIDWRSEVNIKLDNLRSETNIKFDSMDKQFGGLHNEMNARFDSMDKRFDSFRHETNDFRNEIIDEKIKNGMKYELSYS